jgi:hypothetical protein
MGVRANDNVGIVRTTPLHGQALLTSRYTENALAQLFDNHRETLFGTAEALDQIIQLSEDMGCQRQIFDKHIELVAMKTEEFFVSKTEDVCLAYFNTHFLSQNIKFAAMVATNKNNLHVIGQFRYC